MDWLEQELKQALARKEPAPDFAARVARAAAHGPRPRVFSVPRWLPVAAAVLLVAGSGVAYRRHQGMVAKDRVMIAMRITAGTLNHIQTHMR